MNKITIYKPAFFWFTVALLIRLISLYGIYYYSIYIGNEGFYPLASGYDDRYYFEMAIQIMQDKVPDSLPNVYPYILALIFSLVGEHVFFGQLFNVIVSAFTVFVGVLLARDLFDSRHVSYMSIKHPANIAGFLLCIYPFSVFYSTQLLRDSIIQFLGIFNIFFMVRLLKQHKNVYWLFIMFFTLLLFFIRPYASIIIIGSFMLYYFLIERKNLLKKIYTALFIVFPLIAIIPYMAGYGFFGLSYIMPLLSLETLIDFRERAYSIGGSSVGINFNLDNPVFFVGSYLYSFITVLLGPLPWQIKSAVHFFALPEAMFFWVLFPLWIKLLFTFFRGRMQYEGFLLMFAILMIAGIAIFSDNVGANTRLRLLPITVLLILSSGYISRLLTKNYSMECGTDEYT